MAISPGYMYITDKKILLIRRYYQRASKRLQNEHDMAVIAASDAMMNALRKLFKEPFDVEF